MDADVLGQIAFNAACWKLWNAGYIQPDWNTLPDVTKQAWRAAAMAVKKHLEEQNERMV